MELYQTKKLLESKQSIELAKTSGLGENISNYILEKGLISKAYKELVQLNRKKEFHLKNRQRSE